MKKSSILYIIFLFLLVMNVQAQDSTTKAEAEVQEAAKQEVIKKPSNWRFYFNPSFGFTYLNSSRQESESENLQWLGKLQSRLSNEGKNYQLNINLFLQYGQIHPKDMIPEKFQDDFIFTFTPSMTLFRKPAVRLFLETTAETDMGKGFIDNRQTSFLDPLFLYQTLFLGQKQFLIETKGNNMFEMTYGVGYAFQQTLTRDFREDTLSGSPSQTTFESGMSAVFQIDMNVDVSKSLKMKLNTKALAFSKKDFFKDINQSRGSVLLGAGIFYSVIGIEYNMHMVYDKNISPMRDLEQSLMLTFSADL